MSSVDGPWPRIGSGRARAARGQRRLGPLGEHPPSATRASSRRLVSPAKSPSAMPARFIRAVSAAARRAPWARMAATPRSLRVLARADGAIRSHRASTSTALGRQALRHLGRALERVLHGAPPLGDGQSAGRDHGRIGARVVVGQCGEAMAQAVRLLGDLVERERRRRGAGVLGGDPAGHGHEGGAEGRGERGGAASARGGRGAREVREIALDRVGLDAARRRDPRRHRPPRSPQKSPTTLPSSSMSIFHVLGSDGSPGIVRISPSRG